MNFLKLNTPSCMSSHKLSHVYLYACLPCFHLIAKNNSTRVRLNTYTYKRVISNDTHVAGNATSSRKKPDSPRHPRKNSLETPSTKRKINRRDRQEDPHQQCYSFSWHKSKINRRQSRQSTINTKYLAIMVIRN